MTTPANSPENPNEQATGKYYESLLNQPVPNIAALNLFFAQMPKGGDIHHHYSGSIYAETFLDWVAQSTLPLLFIDTTTFQITQTAPTSENKIISVDTLRQNSELYRQVVDAWSDEDFTNHIHDEPPPDQQFFATFGYFGQIAAQNIKKGLQIIKNRAKAENVQYIETMLTAVNYTPPAQFGDAQNDALLQMQIKQDAKGLKKLLAQYRTTFLADKTPKTNLRDVVTAFNQSIVAEHAGLDDANFTLRYQVYAYRGAEPISVFAVLCAGFEACKNQTGQRLLVGVNIVGAENAYIALRDYWLHMQMFAYLRSLYPDVKVAMHAGELTLGLVTPEDLTFHISQALSVAGPDRIGHGVDITYETDAFATLQKMAQKRIPVEVNLTSNEFILGVSGAEHPITVYKSANVPFVISTDDSGVSRNNLTSQYVLLASRYRPSYAEIKAIVANGIEYSFLSTAEKSAIQTNLKKAFATFESAVSKLSPV
jgi:adenosine deaminase